MHETLRRLLKSPRNWQFALAAYWLVLFVATHVPNRLPQLPGAGSDKLAHLSAFALLAVILAVTWQLAAGHLTARHLFVAWIVIALYAALDEWTQSFVGRSTSFWDWVADASGALAALVLFAWLRGNIAAPQ